MIGFIVVAVGKFVPRGRTLGAVSQMTQSPFEFDDKIFYQGVAEAQAKPYQVSYKIRGGVVPHYTLMSYMIAGWFQALGKQGVERIIVIGPNHYDAGSFKIISGVYGWETAFGLVEADTKAIQNLESTGLIRIDDAVLTREHAIGALVPYLKYYLPKAKIVPLILKSDVNMEDSEKLSEALKPLMDEKTVVVVSMDFSHYLTWDKAEVKDQETVAIIKAMDTNKLMTFVSDHVDSRGSITTLIKLMKELGATKLEIMDHNNSGALDNNNLIPTTSTFVMGYH
jgi:AmmeMemoRadiSam system protein B